MDAHIRICVFVCWGIEMDSRLGDLKIWKLSILSYPILSYIGYPILYYPINPIYSIYPMHPSRFCPILSYPIYFTYPIDVNSFRILGAILLYLCFLIFLLLPSLSVRTKQTSLTASQAHLSLLGSHASNVNWQRRRMKAIRQVEVEMHSAGSAITAGRSGMP